MDGCARGWPFRVRRLGCFEQLGDGGRVEMQFGTGDFREEVRRAGDGQQEAENQRHQRGEIRKREKRGTTEINRSCLIDKTRKMIVEPVIRWRLLNLPMAPLDNRSPIRSLPASDSTSLKESKWILGTFKRSGATTKPHGLFETLQKNRG